MEVTIFTETSSKAPKIKEGWYAAAVECVKGSETHVRYVSGYEKDSTRNRLELLAIIAALGRLNRPCTVEIVTSCKLIASNAKAVKEWETAGWTRARGKRLKNKDLWQQYCKEKERHKIAFTHSVLGVYEEELKKIIEKEQKQRHT